MKKIIISFALIFGLLSIISVQKSHAQVDFGLRAGLNFSNFYDTADGSDLDSRTGFMVGGFLNFKVPMSPISIQPEVLYTQNGYEAANDITLELDYIQVPVLAKFSFAPGPAQPHVYVGPYVGIPVTSKVSGGGVSIDTDNEQTDFGGIVGAGVDFNVGLTKLNVGGRYGFGLTNAFDGGQGKNSVISIVAGLNF
ncbi:porin family protein [Fodinibius sp. Rm-B-1B1-1]|uniref:porin family protein n=1 Tax=Fodinibius alkaliphilus TaxID=3140241 RepID=UPI00315AFF31